MFAKGSSPRRRVRGEAGVLVVCALGAAAYLAIGWARGDAGLAVAGPAIMVGYALVLVVLRRRSEPVALLAGRAADERQRQIMLRASAATGQVLVLVLVGCALVALAAGSAYAQPLCYLCAVGGTTFAAATFWYSRRG